MTEIKDVYYFNWSDKNAPKQYWKDIEDIANQIGAALHRAGIAVFQSKEKFGECRVYVSLSPKHIKKYRKIYLKFKEQWPQYWNQSIRMGADYPEFLCDDEAEFEKIAEQRTKDYEEYNAKS